jgi:hypothetical protein
LPDKYRVPVVLCDLEGKSRKQVAGLLQIPEGTLSSRLAYARKHLAKRLSRPGLVLPAGALAAVLCHNAALAQVPGPLVLSTTRAAVGQAVPRAAVVTLTQEIVKAMFISKLKVVWAVALAVVVGAGIAGLAYTAVAQPAQNTPQVDRKADAPRLPQSDPVARDKDRGSVDELEALRLEIEALRKGLQATRARLKALENEVRTLRGTKGASNRYPKAANDARDKEEKADIDMVNQYRQLGVPKQPKAISDYVNEYRQLGDPKLGQKGERAPLADLETILKKLRLDPDGKEAADTLERALKLLKMRRDRKSSPRRQ